MFILRNFGNKKFDFCENRKIVIITFILARISRQKKERKLKKKRVYDADDRQYFT